MTLTKRNRFWLQHDGSDKLAQARRLLETATMAYESAGYHTVVRKLGAAIAALDVAWLSAGGAHAHSSRGWSVGDESGDEAVNQ